MEWLTNKVLINKCMILDKSIKCTVQDITLWILVNLILIKFKLDGHHFMFLILNNALFIWGIILKIIIIIKLLN